MLTLSKHARQPRTKAQCPSTPTSCAATTAPTTPATPTTCKPGWPSTSREPCPGYTSGRNPVELVWTEEFPTRDEAFAAERRIKGWRRAKKEALIAGDWDKLRVLAKGRSKSG